MKHHDENRIIELNEKLSNPLEIGVVLNDHPRSDDMRLFLDRIAVPDGKVKFFRKNDDSVPVPEIQLCSSIRFRMIPMDNELAAFSQAIEDYGNGFSGKKDLEIRLNRLKIPAIFRLFVAPQCPHCPTMIQQMVRLAIAHPLIDLTVIDASVFSETAAENDIRSVPTLILDEQFRWTGTTPPDEIIDILIERDPGKLSPATFEKMISNGDAGKLADMMLESKSLFPAFIDVLLDEHLSVRLGAMVAMEAIAEADSKMAQQVIEPLIRRFNEVGNTVKGDLLYILGMVGTPETITVIRNLAVHESDVEIGQAAQEAVEDIVERFKTGTSD